MSGVGNGADPEKTKFLSLALENDRLMAEVHAKSQALTDYKRILKTLATEEPKRRPLKPLTPCVESGKNENLRPQNDNCKDLDARTKHIKYKLCYEKRLRKKAELEAAALKATNLRLLNELRCFKAKTVSVKTKCKHLNDENHRLQRLKLNMEGRISKLISENEQLRASHENERIRNNAITSKELEILQQDYSLRIKETETSQSTRDFSNVRLAMLLISRLLKLDTLFNRFQMRLAFSSLCSQPPIALTEIQIAEPKLPKHFELSLVKFDLQVGKEEFHSLPWQHVINL